MQVQCQPGTARIYFLRKTRPQLIRNASRVRVMNRAHRVIKSFDHNILVALSLHCLTSGARVVAFPLVYRFSELAKALVQPVNASASAVDFDARFRWFRCDDRTPEKTETRRSRRSLRTGHDLENQEKLD